MRTKTITGYYGSGNTPCDIFVYEERDGSSWYVVEGSVNVNRTYEELNDGVNVEEVTDVDMFTASGEIYSEYDLEQEMNI